MLTQDSVISINTFLPETITGSPFCTTKFCKATFYNVIMKGEYYLNCNVLEYIVVHVKQQNAI